MKHTLLFLSLFLCSIFNSVLGQTLGLLEDRFEAVRARNKIESIRRLVGNKPKEGKIQFYTETEAFFNTEGKLLEYIRYLPTYFPGIYSEGKEITLIDYDEKGRKIKHIKKVEFKEKELNRIYQNSVYTYDDHDKLIKIVDYKPDGSTETTKGPNVQSNVTTITSPEIEGIKVTTKSYFQPQTNSSTQFDSVANRYIYREFTRKKKLLYEKTIQLNDKNRITEIVKSNLKLRTINTTKIRYDEDGNEVERIEFDKAGNVIDKYLNSFYENGLLAQTIWTTKKDVLLQVIKYEYFYY